jgi:hypothetical protein
LGIKGLVVVVVVAHLMEEDFSWAHAHLKTSNIKGIIIPCIVKTQEANGTVRYMTRQ